MTEFNDLGLAEGLLRAVSAEGYTSPTPIQAGVIPVMLDGCDVVAIAQTGTGKTASFVLPLLDRIARERTPRRARSAGALILAPTRELAAQIADSIRRYGRNGRVSTAVIVGGAKPGPQIRAMAPGVDIIVATPGRLLDHMSTGVVRLDQVRTVVLDEADQMLDLGFLPPIRQILATTPSDRQTTLFSATMPKPIRKLAADILTNPTEVAVAPAAKPIELIDQTAMRVEGPAKRKALLDILEGKGVERAIVFTRTKRGADRVNLHLQKAGLSADALHGNKSQGQRQRTLAAFRSGRVNVLVATDIAARGIDIDDVSHVINFELPNVPEAYVHRIGRTARAGKSGIAVSLYDDSERVFLRDIEKLIGRTLDDSAPRGGEKPTPGRANGAPSGNGSGRPKRRRRRPGGGGASPAGGPSSGFKKKRSRSAGFADHRVSA